MLQRGSRKWEKTKSIKFKQHLHADKAKMGFYFKKIAFNWHYGHAKIYINPEDGLPKSPSMLFVKKRLFS